MFIYNNNYFAVIISNREAGKALYYNIIDVAIKVPGAIRDIYNKFLAAISMLNIILNCSTGPKQLNFNLCGLLVLKAAQHIFRKEGSNVVATK